MVMRVSDRLVPVSVSMPSARRSVRICDFVTGELLGSLLRKSTLMRRAE
jgi:hypothetical protein